MVADALSRVPGSETLLGHMLCSCWCTLGVSHVDDGCADMADDVAAELACHGVISLFENASFL